MNKFKASVPAIAVFLGIVITAEILVGFGWVPSYLIPRPRSVFDVLIYERSELGVALFETSLATFVGFLISSVIGVLSAILIQRSSLLDRALYPYAVFFQTVPIIAIAPLLVIWIGFGISTVIASSAIVCIFPIISNTLDGLRSVNPARSDLFRLYQASARDTLFRLRLPSSLPYVFSGLRVASGLAVIGAIVGEFVAGGGIGGIVDTARTQQRVDKVFASILLGSLLGLAMVKLVDVGRSYFLRRDFVNH